MLPQPFDGYPYLVTRIGHSALRDIELLPADWSRERLLDLTRRQAIANQFETCLCLGPTESVFVEPDGTSSESAFNPTGIWLVNRLPLAEPIPDTPELAARHERLEAFVKSLHPSGNMVGDRLEGGRAATREEFVRLRGRDAHGIPIGLDRCPTCQRFAGDYLAIKGEGNGDMTPRVLRVHCACENHNRCARCGEPLAESRLSAYEFNEEDGKVWYAPAFMGLDHRCPASRPTA